MRNLIEGLKGMLGYDSYKNQTAYGLGRDQIDPEISALISVYRQANGIIFSAKAILNPTPTAPSLVEGSVFNPLSAIVNLQRGADGVFELQISGLPTNMDLSEPKIIVKAYPQYGDAIANNIRIIGRCSNVNDETKLIGIEFTTYLYSAINTAAFPLEPMQVYLEVSHI